MAINPDFLEIIVCPENRTRLRLADSVMLNRFNSAIESGRVTTRGGEQLSQKVDGLLITKGGDRAYQIVDRIPNLLIEDSIDLLLS